MQTMQPPKRLNGQFIDKPVKKFKPKPFAFYDVSLPALHINHTERPKRIYEE